MKKEAEIARSARGLLIPVPGDTAWAVGPDNSRISSWTLDEKPITIGRSSECDIVIRDSTVSRRHAEVQWHEGRLLLTHLSATNPTLLNSVPVPRASR